MDRRRFILVATGTSLAAVPALARAQTSVGGCTVGFVNGILQFSPDCALLTPPGLDFAVAPPSHLAPAITDEAPADGVEIERLVIQRDRKRSRLNRRRDREDRRLSDRRNGRRRKTENRRETREPNVRCSDFTYQEDAQAFFEGDRYDEARDPDQLDRNGNGDACDHLPKKPPPATPATG